MPLRIVVHDYSGHPFQVQLSRELARRGHDVLHLHCPSYGSGKGALEVGPTDPPGFRTEAVHLDRPFDKYSPARRILQERSYGRRLVSRIQAEAPDVVLSSNTPLLAQQIVVSTLGLPFVFWQQDVYSVAMRREVERRLPPLVGGIVGRRFVELERKLLDQSDAVVTIAEDFRTMLLEWGLPAQKLHVIENWAPLEELPARPRDNDWARRHGLGDKPVLLYSGTLGLKHDPSLLLRLAHALPEARVVVVSEGAGADWLRERPRENLILLGFQPYEALPDVLGAGDVLLAILEQEAGRFAVPSKILTYLCATRPLLAAVPAENLAARIVAESGAGLLVAPDDAAGFIAGAELLLADPGLGNELGAAARAYAERTFDIAAVGERFEEILLSVTQVRSPR